ncbi:ribosome biogenesis GTP-binding protein YihA/YsxC [Pontibacter sp. G13]|uniref:ribosome biogenesis GTP-binding protein YihA/YsxC n=1 Tax=Pontibacter sp. G13 TaxID=3074898 RepID=UPI002889AEAB|nr:ribosome biogenesis GTP-binding protein YihA/YsxC [Pontibacter sp. G13]WNJ19565.1 ribosome biogenesis GTP-binding protein YihA/YsxC [Pontibacter sp. G13]
MEIKSADFLVSSAKFNQLPAADRPEYAFVGRSNVGKSSLINALVKRKNLAKTSSTPGKTQLINHFTVNKDWYLVDLPGYGYAKASKKKRESFATMISEYIEQRENLMTVFVLIDSRVKPMDIDMEFLRYLGIKEIPFTIVFTKRDKLSQKQFAEQMRRYKDRLLVEWEELPNIILTSSVKGTGMSDILDFIEDTNKLFKPPA